MGGMKISELDFVRLLPAFMRDDEAVNALSRALNKLLGEPSQRFRTLSTWDSIDELTAAECDELAWEMDIDWYSNSMTLEEKRQTIKDAREIKRKRGTKWAVDHLIQTQIGTGQVVEWFETGGKPYTFEIFTDNPDISDELYQKFVAAVDIAKNERSRLLGVSYLWTQDQETGIEYTLGRGFHRYTFRRCGETAPKKGKLFADQETGQKYFIYVEAGSMRMKPTTSNATPAAVYIDARDTGQKYRLFVADGDLLMEASAEAAAASNITLDDVKTGEPFLLYVSGGDLHMESVNA